MYLEHFGLSTLPFALAPDTDFAFRSHGQLQAFQTLRVALEGGEGFVKITGEVGTGKTLLCRRLLDHLAEQPQRWAAAWLPNPALTPRQAAIALATELGLKLPARCDERTAVTRIEQCLIEHAAQGRSVVLAIDEAQAMPEATLEMLRLLSNIETRQRRLLQIVLFGQPELDELLAGRRLRSLASRIGFAASMGALDFQDFQAYLRHRIGVAGWKGGDLWSLPARWWLWRASAGIPRAANLLAHKSLMLAYGAGVHRVGLADARLAVRDHAATAPRPRREFLAWLRPRRAAYADARHSA